MSGLPQAAYEAEVLGALGLARMFLVAVATGAALFDADGPVAQARRLDDRRFALDHLETKLFMLPAQIHPATGRDLVEEGAESMAPFRSRLLREIG